MSQKKHVLYFYADWVPGNIPPNRNWIFLLDQDKLEIKRARNDSYLNLSHLCKKEQILAGGTVVVCFTRHKDKITFLDLGLGDLKKILDERRFIRLSWDMKVEKFLQVAPDLCVFSVASGRYQSIETVSFTLDKLPKALEVWFHTMP